MPTSVPFYLGGTDFQCPVYEPDLGSSLHPYQKGSPLFEGRPMIKVTWANLPSNQVQQIRALYNTLVTSFNPAASNGTPISVKIPDYLHGGMRLTDCYFTEPTGIAGGDGTRNFSITLYCLHETSFEAALAAPEGDLWTAVAGGCGIIVGASEYTGTGWQF